MPTKKKTSGPDPGRILNYTTDIPPLKSRQEIQAILEAHGARAISVLYGDDREVSGIGFVMMTSTGEHSFAMHVNWQSVKQRMVDRHDAEIYRRNGLPYPSEGRLPWNQTQYLWGRTPPIGLDAQAMRTAWRILKDAIEVMLNIGTAGIADPGQVFFGFGQLDDGSGSIYDSYEQRAAAKALAAGR